jgi:guanylate kinase
MPPSVEELEIRLQKRSTESEENLKKRLEKARHE